MPLTAFRITATRVDSEPVPEVVGTATKGVYKNISERESLGSGEEAG